MVGQVLVDCAGRCTRTSTTPKPKQIRMKPTIIGRSAGSTNRILSSGSFLWNRYISAEAT